MSPRRAALLFLVGFHLLFFRRAYLTSDTFFLRDYSIVQTPVKALALAMMREGLPPIWIPSLSGGQPLLANPNYFTFHPGNVLPLLLGVKLGLKAFVLAHYLLASLGAMLLGRRLGLPEVPSLLLSIAFAYGGFLCALGNLINSLAVAALAPWVLLVADRLAAGEGRVLHLALLSAVQIFAGEPVPAILTWSLAIALPIARPRGRSAAAIKRVLTGFGLAILIAAPQVVPAIVFFQHSDRRAGLGPEAALKWSLPPTRLAELLFPELLGSTAHSAPPRYLGGPFEDDGYPYIVSVFVGPVVLLLFGLGVATSRPCRMLGIATLSAVLLGLGHHLPLMPLVQALVPGATIFRYPSKLFLVVSILTAIGAGAGLTHVSEAHRAREVAVGALGLVASLLCGALVGPAANAIASRSLHPGTDAHDDAVSCLVVPAYLVVAILLAASLLLLLHGRGLLAAGLAQKALLGLHAATALLFMPKVLPMVSIDFYDEEPPPVQAIRRHATESEPYRVYWEPWKPPLMLPRREGEDPTSAAFNARAVRRLGQEFVGRLYGIEYAFETGWEGVALASIRRDADALGALPWPDVRSRLDAANVRYVVSFESHPDLPVVRSFHDLERRPLYVYENPTFRPRVEPADAARLLRRDAISYDIMLTGDVASVRLSANAYPLWRAYADGRRIAIAGDEDASEIVVSPPKGTHMLRFVLDPWDLKLGLVLSALGTLVAVLLR